MEETIAERKKLLSKAAEFILKSNHRVIDLTKEIYIHEYFLENYRMYANRDWHDEVSAKVVNSRKYKNFIDSLEKIEVNEVKHVDVDPITKKEIVNVFEAECGHVMERDSAALLLKNGKGNAICPAMGCNKRLREKRN
ncbi:hypothetical protein TCON_2003 [Astathelohania contejeani]|uniref:SP-RING-type domain-containing protein n=1 Tax=Astathelohania contejeani TaxID=164912 RepID=A0ABQ7HXB3_9MICR|nr:hypothetical protein TCON_2003 [Thelohania contejeani]